MPIRQQHNSTKISDISPRKLLDEDFCKKKLTTYRAYTLRKVPVKDPKKEKPTWARAEIIEERLAQDEIAKQIKKLNEGRGSVTEKKAALMHFQQGQINILMDELLTNESDHSFEWSLAQLDRKERNLRKGVRETTTITVLVKRAPGKDHNPVFLFQTIERNKQAQAQAQAQAQERARQEAARPQALPPQHPPQPQSLPFTNIQGGGAIKLGSKDKKHHDDSSVSSEYDSNSASDSEYSSSEGTTVSSRSRVPGRRYHNRRSRSRSRRREHHKQYYIEGPRSPEPQHRDSRPYGGPPLVYAPEVPRPIPSFDPLAAALQARIIEGDAQRFERELDREREREREWERERYPPRVIIGEPRAIVSYGRQERRERVYSEPRYGARYEPRYVDERYIDDLRPIDDDLRVRERRAEEYIRRPSEPIFSNPFYPSLPRRYPPSHSSSGW
jgi:hypothetical protein